MTTSLAAIIYTETVIDDDGTLFVIAECTDCGATREGDDPDELDVWIVHHHGTDCTQAVRASNG